MSQTPAPGEPRARRRRARTLAWGLLLVLLLIAAISLLTLPRYVSSRYHRTGIEALASSLTGRTVRIAGKLTLDIWPQPRVIADDVTISGPQGERVSAASLMLDIAPLPLLRGRLLARSIVLQSPHIALPWPVPGGAAAIAPPRWLSALHAQLSNGTVSLGGITLTSVAADIVTGSNGAFNISGTGDAGGTKLAVSVDFGALSASGSAPVALKLHADAPGSINAALTGLYDAAGAFNGQMRLTAKGLAAPGSAWSAPITGSAALRADAANLAFSGLTLQQGGASLSGSAMLALSQPALTLDLHGDNLVWPVEAGLGPAVAAFLSQLPARVTLSASNTRLEAGKSAILLPRLETTFESGPTGTGISLFKATLPGDGQIGLTGTLSPIGLLAADATLDWPSPAAMLAGIGLDPSLLPADAPARLTLHLGGTSALLRLDRISGRFGQDHVSGNAVLAGKTRLSGALSWDQLDLTPALDLLRNAPAGWGDGVPSFDFELTAERARLGAVMLTNFMADAEKDRRLVFRRLSGRLDNGVVVASLTLSPPEAGLPNGGISAGQMALVLPSAQPLIALLPPRWQLPERLSRAPLALALLAGGQPDALATSASLRLGAVSITAAPRIDLLHQTASGAFTLRHPNAIAALKAFGYDAGLAWPGAGSLSLRADFAATPNSIALPDFVLSLGDLTASGQISADADQRLSGEIDADTLALPPIGDRLAGLAGLAKLHGRIGLSANRVLWAGAPILRQSNATLTLTPGRLELALAHASLAGGSLTGRLALMAGIPGAAGKPAAPQLALDLGLSGADPSRLELPYPFPLPLRGGRLDGAADLSASGATPAAWGASLTGGASLTAVSGAIGGFNLAALTQTLRRGQWRLSLLRSAGLGGATPFSHLAVSGQFKAGIFSLAAATLESSAGNATATGWIGVPQTALDLSLNLLPAVPAPPPLTLTLTGSWAAPRKSLSLKPPAHHAPAR